MSEKINKKRTQAKKQNQKTANSKKSSKNSKSRRHVAPYQVNLTVMPQSQTVRISANFNSMPLAYGIISEANDNMKTINQARFSAVNARQARFLRHRHDVEQRRNAARWNAQEKARLHKAGRRDKKKK